MELRRLPRQRRDADRVLEQPARIRVVILGRRRERNQVAINEHGLDRKGACWILGTVDETEKVAIFEVLEAMGLINQRDCSHDSLHDLCDQFETQIHSLSANVKQHVGRCGNGMTFACSYLAKGMKFSGPDCTEEFVPDFGSESRNTREPSFDATEIDRAKDAWKIATE